MRNLFCFLFLLVHLHVDAQSYPSEMVSFSQGARVDGTSVIAIRSNPLMALGMPNGHDIGQVNFVSLGFGGEIVLKFAEPVANGPGYDLVIYETTWGFKHCAVYPETAHVWVSQDGVQWVWMGVTCLHEDNYFDLETQGMSYCQYIKVKDVSHRESFMHFADLADGYDLDAVKAIHGPLVALPVELLSFVVEPYNESVSLRWVTASELNNNYFVIHRSVDCKEWSEVGRKIGNGTSNHVTHYSHIDLLMKSGTYYYKLSQQDFDGKLREVAIASVMLKGVKKKEVERYGLTGTKVDSTYKGVVFILFDDGTVDKRVIR